MQPRYFCAMKELQPEPECMVRAGLALFWEAFWGSGRSLKEKSVAEIFFETRVGFKGSIAAVSVRRLRTRGAGGGEERSGKGCRPQCLPERVMFEDPPVCCQAGSVELPLTYSRMAARACTCRPRWSLKAARRPGPVKQRSSPTATEIAMLFSWIPCSLDTGWKRDRFK